jgi:hypothetical protein
VLKTLLVAAVTLSLIGGGGWGLQALTLARPSRAQLELVQTLHALTDFRGSQATLEVDGRRYRALCTQHWYPDGRVSRVVLDPVSVLTEVGTVLLHKGALASGEFELAGCPRPLGDWLASELVHGASVKFKTVTRGGAVQHELELRPRTLPIVLYVSGATDLPVHLRLTASGVQGTSTVHYSGLR